MKSTTRTAANYPGETAKQAKVMLYPSLKSRAESAAAARGVSFGEYTRKALEEKLEKDGDTK